MPSAPLRPCRQPGCRLTVRGGGYCPAHVRTAYGSPHQRRARADLAKGPDRQFYSSKPWRALRAEVLKEEPYCRCGCGKPSDTVDHTIPRSERPDLELDRANVRAWWSSCHNRKTATFDGGFGNVKRKAQ